MRRIDSRKLSLNLLFLSLFLILSPHPSLAARQHLQIYAIEQEDIDQDGFPDLTTISCACVTNKDLVYVYDRGEDMGIGKEWDKVTDFTNDTWVFDIGADGTAQLIIRFVENKGQLEAQFFDDRNNDGKVEYRLNGKSLSIKESKIWTLKVTTDKYWLLSNGFPNLNLKFFFDGDTEVYSEIVDMNLDGVPDYEAWNVYEHIRKREGYLRPGIWVNHGHTKSALLEDYLFWPFLLSAERPDVENKFDLIPLVTVDWERAVVESTSMGTINSGYPIESGYFIASFSPWEKGKDNYANFENPMAYYDLAQDNDGYPELHIRLEYFGTDDSIVDVGKSPTPINGIRYSWDQNNATGLRWDYKIGLAGRHLISTSVQFKDFSVRTIPYEDLPAWVSNHAWDWGTLVAYEGNVINPPSSEGLYDWPTTNEVWQDRTDPSTKIPGSQQELRNYLIGKSEVPPETFYQNIRPGFRGEFGYLEDQPYLYFSPIDGKLHLRNAVQGVWNIGNGSEVRYEDLDRDGYLDQWVYIEGGVPRRLLISSRGNLIYSGEDKLIIKKVVVEPSSFSTLPPRNHDEWLQLGQKLQENDRVFSAGDLESMVAQFPAPSMEIEYSGLHDFRLTGSGFRFVLQLQPGFSVATDPDRLAELIQEPGDYVVTYNGSRFFTAPLTPVALSIADLQAGNEDEPVETMKWTTLEGRVRNQGLEDAHDQTICAWLSGPHSQQQVFSTVLDLIPGEGARGFRWDWLPEEAGTWQAGLEVGCDLESAIPGSGQALASIPIDVQPSSASLGQLITLGGSIREEVLYLLFSISLFAAGVVAFLLRRGG